MFFKNKYVDKMSTLEKEMSEYKTRKAEEIKKLQIENLKLKTQIQESQIEIDYLKKEVEKYKQVCLDNASRENQTAVINEWMYGAKKGD